MRISDYLVSHCGDSEIQHLALMDKNIEYGAINKKRRNKKK